jgi:subtilisin family serine protease
MRKQLLCAALLSGLAVLGIAPGALAKQGPSAREFVVAFERGTSSKEARAAVAAAGGKVVDQNRAIDVATVRSSDPAFARKADAQAAISGAVSNSTIGHAPNAGSKQGPPWRRVEEEPSNGDSGHGDRAPVNGDQLSSLQWDMQMIGATPAGSYARQQGSTAVRVGIMDTGIDASHPDIAPNFDRTLSRNFTVDNPVPGIDDGPCEHDGCVDPNDEDDDGHGTHVAGTVAGALNGIGIAGVAPKVDLVNVRVGQDSGFFLLEPFLAGLTYAAENGIDVVNMSFFIDPWLFNCTANPADSPAEQQEQRDIIEMTQRAVDFARSRGVTIVAAAGNEFTDLGNPTFDDTSPDFGPAPHERTIDNGCLTEPTEAEGVVVVSSVGPVEPNLSPFPRKSFFSNYGTEQIDVAAPGGDSRVFFGTPQFNAPQNRILNAYPLNVAQACQEVDANGVPNGTTICDVNNPGKVVPRAVPLVRDCFQGTCALYQWIQGTSMAAPHAVGVAALIVAENGRRDRVNGGLTLAPDKVARILREQATDTPCPAQEPFQYPFDAAGDFTATCVDNADVNGFYGDGIVNAEKASH